MMIGLPGSGKSTIAKELSKKQNAHVHSSDEIRHELYGNEDNQDNNEEVFKKLNERINRDLSNGKNVIYDATNLSYKKRKIFLHTIKTECIKECQLIAVPYEECVNRNNKRNRKVSQEVMKKMYKSFFVPQYYEGWDNIEIHYNYDENESYDIDSLLEDLEKISQDNPHHSLTIGEHCKMCKEYMSGETDDEDLIMAALLHDIGKKFTKDFKDLKGNPTEIAHFYSHQNVSAYLCLFYLRNYDKERILKITNYIQWHMQPFDLRSAKSKKKAIGLFGEEFYNDLFKLHESDINAK